jgi:hypothetical protein
MKWFRKPNDAQVILKAVVNVLGVGWFRDMILISCCGSLAMQYEQ